jgi:hypothetical protein
MGRGKKCCSIFLEQESHTIVGRLTPKEVFTGTKIDVSHLYIWGIVCYFHVPSEKRRNMDPIAVKGFLFYFSEAFKAYMIYFPVHMKFIVCMDVQFEEEQALSKSRYFNRTYNDPAGARLKGKYIGGIGTEHRIKTKDTVYRIKYVCLEGD